MWHNQAAVRHPGHQRPLLPLLLLLRLSLSKATRTHNRVPARAQRRAGRRQAGRQAQKANGKMAEWGCSWMRLLRRARVQTSADSLQQNVLFFDSNNLHASR